MGAVYGLLVSIENGFSVDVLMINRHYVKSSIAAPARGAPILPSLYRLIIKECRMEIFHITIAAF